MTKHILVFLRFRWILVNNALTSLRVKLAWGVPSGHILLCWRIAMTFLGVQVQQFRPLHILDLPEYSHQFLDIMSVEGTKIADVHAFKHVLLVCNSALKSIGKTLQTVFPGIVHQALSIQPIVGLELDSVVGLIGTQIQQILLHSAYTTVYRHVIVVEDNQQVVRRGRNVVQSFECQATTHGAIADDSYHMTFFLAFQLGSDSHT